MAHNQRHICENPQHGDNTGFGEITILLLTQLANWRVSSLVYVWLVPSTNNGQGSLEI